MAKTRFNIERLEKEIRDEIYELKGLHGLLKPKGKDIPSKKPDLLLSNINLLYKILRIIDKLKEVKL